MPDLSKKHLEAVGRTDATSPAVIGGYVVERLTFPSNDVSQVFFTRRQYAFANAFRKSFSVDRACEASGMTRESALRFLRSPKAKAWMQSRDEMAQVRKSWSAQDYWYQQGAELYEREKVSKHKVDIWKEFGDRAAPKPTRDSSASQPTKIEINIDPEAIERSRQRRAAIDAQIVEGEAAA